jgi:hypothetical protein
MTSSSIHVRSNAKRTIRLLLASVGLVLFISGYVTSDEYLTEQEALDAAWEALEPTTASHDQTNWQAT